MSEQSNVTAAGVLDQLFQLLFKGMDNILDAAAEYQNDMGKLKQVTRLDVVDADNNLHEVVVKLAPVKNHDGSFYVEVECDSYPDFNGEGVHQQVFTFDKNNPKQLNKIISDLLKKNGLRRVRNEDTEDDSSKTSEVECYDSDEYEKWAWPSNSLNQRGQKPKIIIVNVTESAVEGDYYALTFECKDRELIYDADKLSKVPEDKVDKAIYRVLENNGLIRISDTDEEEGNLEGMPDKEEDTEGHSTEEGDISLSNHVDVTLSYIKSSDEVDLSAIYASGDIKAALDSVDQLVNDDTFIAMLTEDPQSFRITDEGEDFDIIPIDTVDTRCCVSDISGAINNLSTLLDAYYVNLTVQQQAAANVLLNALEQSSAMFEDEDIVNDL